jgi:hypothetical protein
VGVYFVAHLATVHEALHVDDEEPVVECVCVCVCEYVCVCVVCVWGDRE